MKKITSDDYFVPVIEALQVIKVFGTGTTSPLLIRGICTTTFKKDDYVIKLKGGPRMSIEASSREMIASFIATELDLNVPEAALINLSSEFASTVNSMGIYSHVINSLGLNFGTKYESGLIEFVRNPYLNESQLKQAEEIFAFDTFISNPDRRIDKQNMLTDGNKILIFDHELAFSFVLYLFKNQTPWIFNEVDNDWIKRHFFYSTLKGNNHTFDNFVQKFTALNQNFWNKVKDLLPQEWKTNQVNQIQQTISEMVYNKEKLLEELYRILS